MLDITGLAIVRTHCVPYSTVSIFLDKLVSPRHEFQISPATVDADSSFSGENEGEPQGSRMVEDDR